MKGGRKKEIYAGVLMRARYVEVTFAERVGRLSKDGYRALVPVNGLDGDHWVVRPGYAVEALRAAAGYIGEVCPNVKAIGCGAYGPLLSVSLEDRESEDGTRAALYGVINENTCHGDLQGLPVYHVLREGLEDRGVNAPVRVQTDVVCGALAESFARCQFSENANYRVLRPSDSMLFMHLSDGVGGAHVVGRTPLVNGLHSEIGYTLPQLRDGDPVVDELKRERRDAIFLQDVLSLEAVLRRANLMGGRKRSGDVARIKDIPANSLSWEYVVHYLAQACALGTTVLPPHQIVLHGEIIDEAEKTVKLLQRVQDKFLTFVGGKDRLVMVYDEMKTPQIFIDRALAGNPMLEGAVLLGVLEGRGSVMEELYGDRG